MLESPIELNVYTLWGLLNSAAKVLKICSGKGWSWILQLLRRA